MRGAGEKGHERVGDLMERGEAVVVAVNQERVVERGDAEASFPELRQLACEPPALRAELDMGVAGRQWRRQRNELAGVQVLVGGREGAVGIEHGEADGQAHGDTR